MPLLSTFAIFLAKLGPFGLCNKCFGSPPLSDTKLLSPDLSLIEFLLALLSKSLINCFLFFNDLAFSSLRGLLYYCNMSLMSFTDLSGLTNPDGF
jgi:hypothetical protein